jgi:spore coat protein CotH
MRYMDTYNNTEYMIQSMLGKEDNLPSKELFETYFNKVLKRDFLKDYQIELQYSENYSHLLEELKRIRKSLIVNN